MARSVSYNTITILSADCPTTVTFTPSAGPFTPGDILTCSSDGYPESSYQWTGNNAAVVSSTSTVTLTAGVFNLTCTATGNLAAPCSAAGFISGIANGEYQKQYDSLATIK